MMNQNKKKVTQPEKEKMIKSYKIIKIHISITSFIKADLNRNQKKEKWKMKIKF